MITFFKQNENLVAWLCSLASIPLLLLVLWLNLPPQSTGMPAEQKNYPQSPARRQLLLEIIRLKSRINICEQAIRAEGQYRSSCTPEEQKRLPEYKQKLQKLKESLPGNATKSERKQTIS